MAGRIFRELPEELVREIIARKPEGWRWRTPPAISKHNPLFVVERKKAVCQEALAGETREEIARRHRINIRTVKRYLKENNIQTREEDQRSLEERIRLALRLKTPVKIIAEREGKSRQWIYQVIKDRNLK